LGFELIQEDTKMLNNSGHSQLWPFATILYKYLVYFINFFIFAIYLYSQTLI
jgi:hypothetical protein